MLARIRTIKPEFWDSPGTARASLRARLFFIALWNWADDYGVGTANPNQLVAFVFPNDEIDTRTEFPRLRTEVSDCYGVQWYEVDSRPYYCIPTWDQHQKNERRAKGKFPGPDQADYPNAEVPRGSTDVQALEQGNRGTGEQGNSISLSDSFESNDEGDLLSETWIPTQKHFDHAKSLGLDPGRELERFRDHARRNNRRMKNWNTAFTNWLKKGAEMAQQRQVAGGGFSATGYSKPTAGDKARAIADELRREGL